MDLHVLAGGAVKGLVAALSDAFFTATGVTIVGKFGAVGSMKELLVAGEPCDLIVLTQTLVAELVRQQYVVAGSLAPVGSVSTGIAARGGDAVPEIHDEYVFRDELLAVDAIYVPDVARSTAGIHFVKVLERLGVLDRVMPRLRQHPNGATAMRQMSQAPEPIVIGCTQCTEILYTEGVVLVGPLPASLGLSTMYSAGICSRSAHPDMAARFSELLVGVGHQELRHASGFS